MAYKTNLVGNSSSFATMMANGFGIVTVMNAMVFDAPEVSVLKNMTAYDVLSSYPEGGPGYRCTLDTLKVANVTQEGPTKTITGGQYSNPLVKFGKSARLEIQDALGHNFVDRVVTDDTGMTNVWRECTRCGEIE
jgi:hypothetical protein